MSYNRICARNEAYSTGIVGSSSTVAAPGKRTQVDLLGHHPASMSVIGDEHEKRTQHHNRKIERDGTNTSSTSGTECEMLPVMATMSGSSGVNMGQLRALLVRHEGNRDHVYLDSKGNLTAGIGHLLDSARYFIGQKISHEQIEAWYKEDVHEAISGAQQVLGASLYDHLPTGPKLAVTDMAFNMGAGKDGLGSFHQMIHALRVHNYSRAASEMLDSPWPSQVGNRAYEDAKLMRAGDHPIAIVK